MQFISKIFNFLNPYSFKGNTYKSGPMTLEELLKQFDAPIKEKSNQDIIRDYQVRETLAALEVDMLKLEPSNVYKGCQFWIDYEGKKFYDFVPCVTRPEVIYCSYGKN